MNLPKDLSELISAQVISEDTAHKIRNYYERKAESSSSRLIIAFGILGSILVGLGIILIIAHNWDELSRNTKAVLAFLPLVVGQILCAYTLLKKPESVVWRESSASFLFFSVGACIALVSQVYNIPGDTAVFLLTWMALCLLVVYVMRSSAVSLLFLLGITNFASESGYSPYTTTESYFYWILLIGVLPHYYNLFKSSPNSNFLIFHNWVLPASIVFSLGIVSANSGEFMYLAYMSLFGLFYLLGKSDHFSHQKTRNNGFLVIGTLGTLILLLFLSFDYFWLDLAGSSITFGGLWSAPEFYATLITTSMAGWLLYLHSEGKSFKEVDPIATIFLVFILLFIVGLISSNAVILINILVLALGILLMRDGTHKGHLGILNLGLLLISALIISRFFDNDISFVLRGIVFVLVGAGFFVSNYWILKNRRITNG
jgi:uncharacterized membrane protein